MVRIFTLISLAFVLSACLFDSYAGESDGCSEPASETYEGAPEGWRAAHLAHGKDIYGSACASCHDPGASSAPTIGQQDEWSSRSKLWCAVLFEHAKQGYLDMPAKGGQAELNFKDVDAAAEYMLSVTFPELPID